MKHNEYHLQKSITAYLRLQYPNVIFLSTGTSLKLTAPQQVRNKAINSDKFAIPDLIILHPNRFFHGLCMELKVESPFKKDGSIKASQGDHLEKQNETINQLGKLGYYAAFCWSFGDAKNIIDYYMGLVEK